MPNIWEHLHVLLSIFYFNFVQSPIVSKVFVLLMRLTILLNRVNFLAAQKTLKTLRRKRSVQPLCRGLLHWIYRNLPFVLALMLQLSSDENGLALRLL